MGDLLGRYVGGERRYEVAQLLAMSDAALARVAEDYSVRCDGDKETTAEQICVRQMDPLDSPVIKALKRGETLLLDEINLAPAAVVERLDSLFEDDGNIVLVEHRNEMIAPSPDFRLFATMNPSH